MMEPVVGPLADAMRRIRLRPPRIRIAANVTGRWLSPEEAMDRGYWARQLRAPVRCAEGLALLFDPGQALIEVGPGTLFTKLVSQFPRRPADQPIVHMLPRSAQAEDEAGTSSRPRRDSTWRGCLSNGIFHADEGRRRIPLPAHPFQKERCWIEPDGHAPPAVSRKPESEWFYLPGWRRSVPPQLNRSAGAGTWLLAGASGQPLPRALASLMRESQAEVIELPAWPESVTEWREAIQALQGLRGIVLFEENGGIAEMLSIIGLAQALPGRPVTLALATRELLHVSGTARPRRRARWQAVFCESFRGKMGRLSPGILISTPSRGAKAPRRPRACSQKSSVQRRTMWWPIAAPPGGCRPSNRSPFRTARRRRDCASEEST